MDRSTNFQNALAHYQLAPDFEVPVLGPDNPAGANYCYGDLKSSKGISGARSGLSELVLEQITFRFDAEGMCGRFLTKPCTAAASQPRLVTFVKRQERLCQTTKI
ncbi:hypothetical protein CAI21_18675 [Alkalilimnicola ehrlichii]|uniref:Uncharacterized protein n=1 Tax=Alkalilimnicola ehrlichii TaxID=351052 RepID=A0A3E0WKL1_9GAMM|nr:hypothetical protein CAI21_18675 [Alkalilimnicola ehrlichii]RFA32681.1 hypothetical protein CAL65_18930 [Alkalilimnicola ehrlichii]